MFTSMTSRFYDIRPGVLRGDPRTHMLEPYHAAMVDEVARCDVPFPSKQVCMVTSKSCRAYKRAVERMASFFQRELNYDFPQYAATEYSRSYRYRKHVATDSELRGFFWFENNDGNRIENEWPTLGGACFRLREFSDGTRWLLDWVWIHPYARRRHLLTQAWPFFRSMFGDFDCSPPLTSAMASFLEKAENSSKARPRGFSKKK